MNLLKARLFHFIFIWMPIELFAFFLANKFYLNNYNIKNILIYQLIIGPITFIVYDNVSNKILKLILISDICQCLLFYYFFNTYNYKYSYQIVLYIIALFIFGYIRDKTWNYIKNNYVELTN